jgi:hypothetical protein
VASVPGWQLVPGKCAQSALLRHPGKQASTLLLLKMQKLKLPEAFATLLLLPGQPAFAAEHGAVHHPGLDCDPAQLPDVH